MGSIAADYKFEGWQALDASAAEGNMVWKEFEPKRWEESDIDIKVTHCGVCGSDVHTLNSSWTEAPYPLTVGHEIVGVAVRVGSEAEGGIKVGDRVGVGAQGDACLGRFGDCEECSAGRENYCDKLVWTYSASKAGMHLNGDKAQGGFATFHRARSHFVFKIPENIESTVAAPLLCGGVTVFEPLKNAGVGKGVSVGVVGVGGLGHYAVIFAKAMGADKVVGISRKASKRAEVLELGADDYIAVEEDQDWTKKHNRSLDLIISTVDSVKIPINEYLQLLKKGGSFVQVGLPADGAFQIRGASVVNSRTKFTGSLVGSPTSIKEMFELVSKNNLKGLVQERPMKDANQTVVDLEAGKARYRYVLVNEDAA